MVRLSNRGVFSFSWSFFLHRIFRSSVFSRRSKARQTPTHLRSLSPSRIQIKQKITLPTKSINRRIPTMISSQHISRFLLLWHETGKVSAFFSMHLSLSLTRDLWREILRPAADQLIEETFFFFYVGASEKRRKGKVKEQLETKQKLKDMKFLLQNDLTFNKLSKG